MMEKLNPIRIYSLGDYYSTPGLRELCHAVKEGDKTAMLRAAKELRKLLPSDCTLVPVPSLSGNNEEFTRILSECSGRPVYRCLKRMSKETVYELKRRGVDVTEEMTGIQQYCFIASPGGRVVLVDNVIATGTTMSAAIRAIGRPCEAAVIAVDIDANT